MIFLFNEMQILFILIGGLKDQWLAQDNCSYAWGNFTRQNYLTGHLEDAPLMAIFNYLKTGFVKVKNAFPMSLTIIESFGKVDFNLVP